MPQWRKLHTKVTESLDLNDMPDDFHRLLWVLLPTQLCREGRGVDTPSWVRSRVFPLREDVTLGMVSAAMDWYAERGMVLRYQVETRSYFCIPTFKSYQGNTSKEAESCYPPPPEPVETHSGPTPDLLRSSSASDADADVDAEAEVGASRTADGSDAPPATPDPVVDPGAPPEAVPKRTRNDPRSDPRATHPAILLVRGLTGRYPHRSIWSQIIGAVGEHPDGDRAGVCYQAWVQRGYNPQALTWLLEWYTQGDGLPPAQEKPGSRRGRAPAEADVPLERFRQAGGGEP